jgi:hypothetical protein
MKNGEPQESDYVIAEKNLDNLHYLWTQAHLNFMLLNHAVEQMQRFQGIGDTLEDDVK